MTPEFNQASLLLARARFDLQSLSLGWDEVRMPPPWSELISEVTTARLQLFCRTPPRHGNVKQSFVEKWFLFA